VALLPRLVLAFFFTPATGVRGGCITCSALLGLVASLVVLLLRLLRARWSVILL
jgi:hypothetical protein